jgi:hypothetical protein
VRGIFRELGEAWGGIPFVVVNDGELAALAGAMAAVENGRRLAVARAQVEPDPATVQVPTGP